MRKLSVLFALCFSAASVCAQRYEIVEPGPPPPGSIDVNRVRLGGYFAPNASWMKPTTTRSDDGLYRISSEGSKVGYTWGLLVDYFFTPHYGIATGFQLNTTGGSIEAKRIPTDVQPSTVYQANFDYTLQYLEVPFQLKLMTDHIGVAGIRAFGQVGLTAGINIGKKATYTVAYRDSGAPFTGMQQAIGEREKITGSFTIAPVMLQLNIGGGLQKPISPRMDLYFGVFFNNGFLPDATNPEEYDFGSYQGTFSDGNIRLNSIAFRFGLFF